MNDEALPIRLPCPNCRDDSLLLVGISHKPEKRMLIYRCYKCSHEERHTSQTTGDSATNISST